MSNSSARARSHELFLEAYPLAGRATWVRSAPVIHLVRDAALDREDLKQEVLVGVWVALSRFDPLRASLRTFVERIVANRITSLVRRLALHRPRRFVEETFQSVLDAAAPDEAIDLRLDVGRVIATLPPFDRAAARHLADCSVVETSRRLGVSRAAVYRSIRRIKVAFIAAGLSAPDSLEHGVAE